MPAGGAVRQHGDPALHDRASGYGRGYRSHLGSRRGSFVLRRRLGRQAPLRFGGKTAQASGIAIDALVEVKSLARDCWQTFGPTRVPLGDCAAVSIGGVDAVLVTKRNQALGLELFSNLGIDPRALKLIVVKSSTHFLAAFGPIAKKVIYVESGGPLSQNYRPLSYRRVIRPIWPLDDFHYARSRLLKWGDRLSERVLEVATTIGCQPRASSSLANRNVSCARMSRLHGLAGVPYDNDEHAPQCGSSRATSPVTPVSTLCDAAPGLRFPASWVSSEATLPPSD